MRVGEFEIPIYLVVDTVNKSGGRTNPIVDVEKCVVCGLEFISSIQDVNLRKNQGYDAYCTSCKEAHKKELKAEQAKRRRERLKKSQKEN